MKFKATRRARTCHSCKNTINKGSLYTQRSITLGSKQDGQAETFNGSTITVHQMRLSVPICETCATN
jgi:hypothetical protein